MKQSSIDAWKAFFEHTASLFSLRPKGEECGVKKRKKEVQRVKSVCGAKQGEERHKKQKNTTQTKPKAKTHPLKSPHERKKKNSTRRDGERLEGDALGVGKAKAFGGAGASNQETR